MKALIQRVSQAAVEVDQKTVGKIQRGILLLVGFDADDGHTTLEKMADKVLAYRIFPDDEGKMNLSLRDIEGGLLVISQFTLAASTKKGLRPSFSCAAAPAQAKQSYEAFLEILRARHSHIESGIFAADMKVSLINDGPVTFLLDM